jgi:predicted dinucleotide-binding enzyme
MPNLCPAVGRLKHLRDHREVIVTDNASSDFRRRDVLRLGGCVACALMLSTLHREAFGQAAANASRTKIGIIGSGHMGSTLGTLWVKAGHPVMFSSRHPEELAPLVQSLGPSAKAGTVAEAIAFGDVVFIAVPYGAYPQVGKDYAAQLSGKVVLDAGNAVPARDGEIANEARENGIGITSAKYLAGARIVRAFNTLGNRTLATNTNRPEGRFAIPIAGDDQDALAVASTLVQDAGFDPVVIGPLVRAKDFAQGGPLYGQRITAQEMRERLETLR